MRICSDILLMMCATILLNVQLIPQITICSNNVYIRVGISDHKKITQNQLNFYPLARAHNNI